MIGRARTGELPPWLASLARRPPVDPGGGARLVRRYIYILPTGAGVLLGVVLMLMLLGSLNYQNNLALLLTFQMAGVAVVSMFHTWLNLLDLKIAGKGGPPVFAGQEAVFSFELEEDRMRARADLAICIGKRTTSPIALDRNASCSVDITLRTTHRGRVTAEGVRIETRYPLGLFRAWSYPQTHVRVTVYPQPAERGPIPVTAPAVKISDQGSLGTGADDFVGSRDYRTGDSLRNLDWKALARERGLLVKQFGGERAVQVWIDWHQLPEVDTEQRLGLLCRQVLDAAEQGLSYGLRLPCVTLAPDQGEAHRHRCLESLADFGHG